MNVLNVKMKSSGESVYFQNGTHTDTHKKRTRFLQSNESTIESDRIESPFAFDIKIPVDSSPQCRPTANLKRVREQRGCLAAS